MSSELITDPLSPEAQSTQPTPPDVFIMYQKDFEKNHPDLVKLVMFDNNERYKLQCALWRFESADVRDEYWKMYNAARSLACLKETPKRAADRKRQEYRDSHSSSKWNNAGDYLSQRSQTILNLWKTGLRGQDLLSAFDSYYPGQMTDHACKRSSKQLLRTHCVVNKLGDNHAPIKVTCSGERAAQSGPDTFLPNKTTIAAVSKADDVARSPTQFSATASIKDAAPPPTEDATKATSEDAANSPGTLARREQDISRVRGSEPSNHFITPTVSFTSAITDVAAVTRDDVASLSGKKTSPFALHDSKPSVRPAVENVHFDTSNAFYRFMHHQRPRGSPVETVASTTSTTSEIAAHQDDNAHTHSHFSFTSSRSFEPAKRLPDEHLSAYEPEGGVSVKYRHLNPSPIYEPEHRGTAGLRHFEQPPTYDSVHRDSAKRRYSDASPTSEPQHLEFAKRRRLEQQPSYQHETLGTTPTQYFTPGFNSYSHHSGRTYQRYLSLAAAPCCSEAAHYPVSCFQAPPFNWRVQPPDLHVPSTGWRAPPPTSYVPPTAVFPPRAPK